MPHISETCSTGIQTNAIDGDASSPLSLSSSSSSLSLRSSSPLPVNKREKQQRILLVIFASLSTFFYAGGYYGWGPMQLLLEANGNFASLCDDETSGGNTINALNSTATTTITTTTIDNNMVCPDQTAAFLNCKFVSQLTILTGTLWGILSDKYGTKVLMNAFGLCNIFGLVLLIIGVRYPNSVADGPSLYGAFSLMGLGSTVGGILTVKTGLLFKSNRKHQNRVISLLNALFDAGAMSYLGLWELEKISSSSSSSSNASSTTNKPNTNLILIFGGYLLMAIICIGGYSYLFQTIQKINKSHDKETEQRNNHDEETIEGDPKRRITTATITADRLSSSAITLPPMQNGDHPSPAIILSLSLESIQDQNVALPSSSLPCGKIRGEDNISDVANDNDLEESQSTEEEIALPSDPSYISIAQRSAKDQLKSKAYILLGIWFSFHTSSNLWTLTTARDFLGGLGDDAYGNRYLSIFTLMAPLSIIALPFLDVAVNKYGFHVALQTVNALAIAHGITRVVFQSLNAQVLGFVFFTFFRCFLYSVAFSCVAGFVGPTAIGRATGTLFVLSGLVSFANIGLAHLAVEAGDFFVPNLVFLVGTIPMVYLTYEIGRALEKDQRGLEKD